MKQAFLIAIAGAVIAGVLQFLSISTQTGETGTLLYYSPLLVYIACVYVAIKRTRDADPENFSFKSGLKAGAIAALIISLAMGIGFFIALTHTDVDGLIAYLEQNKQHDQVRPILSQITRQAMFDRAQFFAMPYFLLGFFVTIAVTMIFRRRKKA